MKTKTFTFLSSSGILGFALGIILLFGFNLKSNAQAEMILNPGFEEAITNGWTEDWGRSQLVSTVKRSGSYSLQLGDGISGDGGRAQKILTGFTVGGSYHFSGWCKLSEAGAGANIGVICEDAGGTQLNDFMAAVITNVDAFAEYTVDFVIPANTANVMPYIYYYGGTNYVYLDDASLKPVVTNMVLNAGFEEAITNGWTEDWGRSQLVSTVKRSGTYSLQLGDGISGDGGRAQIISTGFTVGSSYHLSGWCKLSEAGAGANIGVICEDAGGTQLNDFMSAVISNVDAFAEYTADFVIPANTTVLKPYMYYYGGTNFVYLDDVDLRASSTGIAKSTVSGSVKLFPNPLTGKTLNVSTPGISGDKSLSIYDMTGRIVFSQKLQGGENERISLNTKIRSGVYIVKTNTKSGDFSQKLIVQ